MDTVPRQAPISQSTAFDAARVLESIGDACYILDSEWRFVYVNARAEQLLRRTSQELIGKSVWDEFPEAVGSIFEKQYRRAAAERICVAIEEPCAPLGSWFDVRAFPFEGGLSVFFQNIDERKRMERDAQMRLEAALSAGGIATWTWDVQNDTVRADANLARLFSVSPEDAAGGKIAVYLQAIHPDDRPRVAQLIEDALAQREVYAAEYRVMLPDGSHRWLMTRGKVERDAEGRAVSLPGVVEDVTERVERERRERFLAELAERTRSLTDPDAVIADAVNSVGRFLDVSRCIFADIDIEADTCAIRPHYRADPSVADIAGVVSISAFGAHVVAEYAARRAVVVDDVRADPVKAPPESVAAYEAIGILAHVTVPVVHSGRVVSCISLHNAAPRHWEPEDVELLRAVVERTWLTVEVLRQQRALTAEAEALQAANARTAAILGSITDAFMALDCDWRFTYVNDQSERVMNRRREDLLGRVFWDEFPAAVGTSFEREYRRAATEQISVTFLEYYPPLDIWAEVRAYPSSDGLSVFYQDVTARKKADDEREQMLAEQRALARREGLLNRVGAALRVSPNPEHVLGAAVRELGQALRADRCYYAAYDQDADTALVGPEWHRDGLPGITGHYRMSAFAVNRDLVYQAGRTQVVADTAGDAGTQALGLLALVRVPLVAGTAMTALAVAMTDEPRDWTAEEVSLIEAVAAQTRSTVEATRLLAERQGRLMREAFIGRLGVAIRSTLDPDLIRQRAATLLGEALGADRCFYVAYDSARDFAQVFQDWRRDDLPSITGEYKASDFTALLSELFPGQRTAVIQDVRTAFSPAVASQFGAARHRAVLSVPYFDEGKLVAALYASMADAPRAWTAEETAMIEQAATLTRAALETARVQVREHAIAQQLQDALQPALPAHIPGLSVGKFTQPALDEAQVGGDFYDLFALDKEVYALVLGDVSGKGLAAAQQLALIRNSLRTTLYLYRAPAQAASALNAIVTAHDLLVGFVTAWVGVYDRATGEIVYCSCGHEPGLVRRAGRSVETLVTTGPPLGVAENAEYSESVVTLTVGDALLLYTDGVSEAGPSRREMLGTEGLIQMLKAVPTDMDVQAQAAALVAGVSAFTNGVFRDDVAVLLVQRQ